MIFWGRIGREGKGVLISLRICNFDLSSFTIAHFFVIIRREQTRARILLEVHSLNRAVSRRKDRKNAERARFFISTFLIAARPVLVILRIFMCHEGEGADGRHALFFSAGLLRQMSHSHVPIKNNPAPSRHFLSVCIFNIRRVAVTA